MNQAFTIWHDGMVLGWSGSERNAQAYAWDVGGFVVSDVIVSRGSGDLFVERGAGRWYKLPRQPIKLSHRARLYARALLKLTHADRLALGLPGVVQQRTPENQEQHHGR